MSAPRTVAEQVAATQRLLAGSYRTELNVLGGSIDDDDTSVILGEGIEGIGRGTILGLGDELVYVWGVDRTTAAVRVKRAMFGTTAEIIEIIKKYWDAFNANDLDRVMIFFSDDAVYQPGDGKTHKGKADIHSAFEPQFDYALGAMRFDEVDRVFDVENRKLTIRYVCRHDISQMKPRGLVMALLKIVAPLVYGEKFGWQGVDVFHFDAEGKIKEKYT